MWPRNINGLLVYPTCLWWWCRSSGMFWWRRNYLGVVGGGSLDQHAYRYHYVGGRHATRNYYPPGIGTSSGGVRAQDKRGRCTTHERRGKKHAGSVAKQKQYRVPPSRLWWQWYMVIIAGERLST